MKPGFAAPKKLRCTCDVDGRLERVPTDQLQPYQRDLKELTEQRYAQLEASMERYGFTSPLLAWTDPKGVVWVLDGHQRLRVLERQGWTVEGGIPVVSVEAADAKEAAEKLLVIASQYGQIDKQGLYEFGAHYDVDLAEFDLAALPEVDWEAFQVEFFSDEDAYADPGDSDPPGAKGVRSTVAFAPSVWLKQRDEIIRDLDEVIAQYGGQAEWAE